MGGGSAAGGGQVWAPLASLTFSPLWLPGPEACASLYPTAVTEAPTLQQHPTLPGPHPTSATTDTPPQLGKLGLRHIPIPSPGLSRTNVQCLPPSCPFAFQDLLGHLGQEREAHRGRYIPRERSFPPPLRTLAHLLLSSPSGTPSSSGGNSCVQRGGRRRLQEVKRGF